MHNTNERKLTLMPQQTKQNHKKANGPFFNVAEADVPSR
jgi:hypothetical protein